MEATGRPLSPPAAAKFAALRSGPFKDAKPPKEVEEDDDVQGAYLGLPTFASKDIEHFNQLEISAMVADTARRVTDNKNGFYDLAIEQLRMELRLINEIIEILARLAPR